MPLCLSAVEEISKLEVCQSTGANFVGDWDAIELKQRAKHQKKKQCYALGTGF